MTASVRLLKPKTVGSRRVLVCFSMSLYTCYTPQAVVRYMCVQHVHGNKM